MHGQNIIPVTPHNGETLNWDIVGPVCETGDFLGKDRKLTLLPGDLLAGNRCRCLWPLPWHPTTIPALALQKLWLMVVITYLIRERESVSNLWAGESLLPDSQSMKLNFTKMHGAGNDFVIIDLVRQQARLNPNQIRRLSDRHRGIGCDQLLLVEPPDHPDADFRYRIFNADGSEASQCGNGARCFAQFVREQKLTWKRELKVQTTHGVMTLRIDNNGHISTDLGVPNFRTRAYPFRCCRRQLIGILS